NPRVSKYFMVVEEYISHILEESFISIFKIIKKACGENREFDKVLNGFMDFFSKENEVREQENYQIIIRNSEEVKEKYLYYMGQFKKIIASVLYLDIEREKKGDAFLHLVGSGAAFAASVLYFTITFYISKRFAIDSLPFVFLISLGYVFKDRVKDFLKIIFNPKVLSMFPDHITQLRDQSDNNLKLGEIREKFFFGNREKMDPEILELRDKTKPIAFLPVVYPEDILVYQKEININTATIREKHSRTVDITDIMRFNIYKYLIKMDDPEQFINYYDSEKNTTTTTTGDRTYHINLVIKYSKFEEEQERQRYERYRIVANKYGIKRIEPVT
ncbi:MAG: hypothetical protein ACLFQV_12355, partial [Vulcanimicrobiota bacterium]